MMKKLKTQRAIALATVMIMVTLLTLMSTAFFQVYRTHFALTRSSMSTQSAAAGCEAVYEYVSFRLEHDKTWGAVPFADTGDSKLLDPGFVVVTEPGTYNFSGRIDSIDAHFSATIYNNLNGGGSAEVLSHAPAGKAYCTVTTTCRESSRRARFMLDIAPLFDASVLTRADLKVGADTLTIRSTDPDRNMIRAEGDIVVPGLLDGHQTAFLTSTNAPDDRGLMWTKKKIYSGGAGTPEIVDTAEKLGVARENSYGKVVPDGESHFSIMDIDETQLQLPDDGSLVNLGPGGRWTFVKREAAVTFNAKYVKDGLFGKKKKDGGGTMTMWVDVLEYYKDPTSTVPDSVFRGSQRIEDIKAAIPEELDGGLFGGDYELDESTIKVSDFKVLKYDGISTIHNEVVSGDAKTYGPHDEVRFDLTNQKVTVNSDATVDVDGPLYITSETDSGAPSETSPPVLDLGYKSSLSDPGGVTKATLVAKGTINIENGVTQGLGRLVSKHGDVRIQPKKTSSVTVDASATGSGLLVYAGKNVILTNPDKTEKWDFRGLVYAREGISMNGGNAGKATFEGTIVALQEHPPVEAGDPNGIEFTDCTNVEFIYNPDLLANYVKELPNQRLQVQSVYWKR